MVHDISLVSAMIFNILISTLFVNSIFTFSLMNALLQILVASLIPALYHTFVEIDHEIISTVIHLPSADLFKKGCCQLQAKVCAQITG